MPQGAGEHAEDQKIICRRRGWQFDGEKHTAKALIDIVFKEGLIPDYLQSQFTALRSVLDSGVPTIRNRAGGHGAGVKRREVPGYLASYTLHLTAAAILFLAEAEAALNEPNLGTVPCPWSRPSWTPLASECRDQTI